MPIAHWSKHLGYTPSSVVLVIYGYQLSRPIADQMGRDIEETYSWINSVWVDCDVFARTTLKLDTPSEFRQMSDARQYIILADLVDQVVNSVYWDFGRQPISYNGIPYRPTLWP